MRELAEHEEDGALAATKDEEPVQDDLFADYVKFDRLNLYDFRRNLPM